MTKNICILQGHPHPTGGHFCHAIEHAYAAGANSAGAKVRRLDIGALDPPVLHNPEEFASPPPAPMVEAQNMIRESQHIVTIYPLWLGTMPALVKAFFEQLSRAEFAVQNPVDGGWPKQMLKGKSARVIVTMGMPAAAYRMFFGAHGVRCFESGILGMAGIKPIRETLIGGIGSHDQPKRERILDRIQSLGERLG